MRPSGVQSGHCQRKHKCCGGQSHASQLRTGGDSLARPSFSFRRAPVMNCAFSTRRSVKDETLAWTERRRRGREGLQVILYWGTWAERSMWKERRTSKTENPKRDNRRRSEEKEEWTLENWPFLILCEGLQLEQQVRIVEKCFNTINIRILVHCQALKIIFCYRL